MSNLRRVGRIDGRAGGMGGVDEEIDSSTGQIPKTRIQ